MKRILLITLTTATAWGIAGCSSPLGQTRPGSVELSISEAVMSPGDSLSIAAASDSAGRQRTSRPVQWSSSNTAVASVTSIGYDSARVIAKAIGATQIIAQGNEVSDTAFITVAVGPPAPAGQIAFTSTGSDSVQHIYVLDLADSSVSQLTSATVPDYAPAWSPDRRAIAFVRGGGDTSTLGLWLMGANGSGPVRLSSHGAATGSRGTLGGPTWSPDGKRIAFFAGTMWVVKADGSGETGIPASLPGHSGLPAWSPDGSTIAFQGRFLDFTVIYLMNADGSRVRRLNPLCRSEIGCSVELETGPAWSPNGKMLAFWSGGFGITVANQDGSSAFSVTKDGYTVTGQPPADGFGTTPDWSSDGRWLVFSRGGQLVVTRADGTGAVQPVTSLTVDAYSPAWSR